MHLQERLDTLRKKSEANLPAETVTLMHRATEELRGSGILHGVRRAGDLAPEFALRDQEDRLIDSGELLARGPLVLSFYRGIW